MWSKNCDHLDVIMKGTLYSPRLYNLYTLVIKNWLPTKTREEINQIIINENKEYDYTVREIEQAVIKLGRAGII